MELKIVRCTTCGYSMKIDATQKQHTCEMCKNTYVIEYAEQLSGTDFNQETLHNARINLRKSIESNDLNAILHFSQIILNIIPKDFSGLYYNAYASSKLVNPKQLYKFLKGKDYKATKEELSLVTNHISNYSDLRDYKIVQQFIAHHNPLELDTFSDIIQKRIELEDNYAIFERDVFICHRSTDSDIANKVVEELENDGNSCWISSRNLRPDDNENYWKNIEDAIEHCSIFLVISSQDAMLSKDVRKELSIASKLKKERIEFKIDDSTHTTLFKHFFDGYKWINAIYDINQGLGELKQRVLDLVFDNNKPPVDTPQAKPIDSTTIQNDSDKINKLLNRLYFDLSLGKFESSSGLLEKIFDLDIETEAAWVAKFMIDNQIRNESDLMSFIEESTLKEIESFLNQESIIAIKKINSNNELILILNSEFKDKISFNKKKALEDSDLNLLNKLADKYPNQIFDSFYRKLIHNNITSLEVLNKKLDNVENYEELSLIFNSADLVEYLFSDIIKPYFEKFKKLKDNYERMQKEEQAKLDEERQLFYKQAQEYITYAQFDAAKIYIESEKEKFGNEDKYSEFLILATYHVKSFDELKSKELSIESKRQFIENENVISLINNESNKELINVYNRFTVDIETYYKKQNEIQTEIKRKRNKKIFRISSIFISIVILIISIFFIYNNMKVSINYELNGGITDSLKVSIRNKDLPYVLPELSKKGYTFLGWYTADNQEITEITAGIFKNENIEAKWSINQYSIHFEENGGSNVEDITQDYNSTLVEPSIEYVGHTFGGWFTDSDFNNPFVFDTVPAEDITLYAKWYVDPHTITIVLNGGVGASNIYDDYGEVIDEPNPTRAGYTFDGWYSDESLTVPYTFTTMPAEDITVYAKWTINQYTIHFEENGGSLVTDITQDFNTNLVEPQYPTRTGYTFEGWFSDVSLTVPYTFTTMPAKDITLYAKWDITIYDITYNLDGGTNGSNPSTYTVETSNITLVNPTKEGYTFEGWFDNTEFTGSAITEITLGTIGDIKLYAKWSINQYTITFYSNGGSTISSITQDYNTAVTAPTDPIYEDNTFEGWYSDIELTQPYLFSTMPARNITLYAKWNYHIYSIFFNYNDGTGTTYEIIKKAGETFFIPDNFSLRDHYTFDGWRYSGVTYYVGESFVTPEHDVTFIAQWIEDPIVTISCYVYDMDKPEWTWSLYEGDQFVFPESQLWAGGTYVGTVTEWSYNGNIYQSGESFIIPYGVTEITIYIKSLENPYA